MRFRACPRADEWLTRAAHLSPLGSPRADGCAGRLVAAQGCQGCQGRDGALALWDAQTTQGAVGVQGSLGRAAANSEPDRPSVRHVGNAGGLSFEGEALADQRTQCLATHPQGDIILWCPNF
jgi:hypothetical protein